MFLLPALVDRACLIVVAAMPTAITAVSHAAMEAPPSRYARLEHTQVTGTHLATIAHQALSSQTLAKIIAGIAQLAPFSLMKVKLAATIVHQALSSQTLAKTIAGIAQLAPTSLMKVKLAATIVHRAPTSLTMAKTAACIAQLAPTSLMKVKPAATIAHQAPTSLTKVVPHALLALLAKRLRKDRRLVIKSPAMLVPTFHPAAATLA